MMPSICRTAILPAIETHISNKNIVSNVNNIKQTLQTLNLIESNSKINNFITNKVSVSKLNQVSEILQNINLISSNKKIQEIKKFNILNCNNNEIKKLGKFDCIIIPNIEYLFTNKQLKKSFSNLKKLSNKKTDIFLTVC